VLGGAIGSARDDRPRRTVSDEDDLAQFLMLQDVDDVGDVDVEADLGASEMPAFAESGQRGCDDRVASLREKRRKLLPEPRAMPGRVNQDERFRIHSLHAEGYAHHSDDTCAAPGDPEHVAA
jgi:hypothetical protein